MTIPVRLQLSRARGFNLQDVSLAINGLPAVNCARPGRWGNPFYVSKWRPLGICLALFRNSVDGVWDPSVSAALSDAWCGYSEHIGFLRRLGEHPHEAAAAELRGKNLACWCAADESCHVDYWREVANR